MFVYRERTKSDLDLRRWAGDIYEHTRQKVIYLGVSMTRSNIRLKFRIDAAVLVSRLFPNVNQGFESKFSL